MHLPWESIPRDRCIFFYVCRSLFYRNYSLLFQHFNQCLNIGQSPGILHVVFPGQTICQRFILYSRAAFLQLFNKVSRRVVEHKHFREVNLFAVTYKHLLARNFANKEIFLYRCFHSLWFKRERL